MDLVLPTPAVDDPAELHRSLAAFNRHRLLPGQADDPFDPAHEVALRRREEAFVAEERTAVAAWAGSAPREPAAFVAWFERLREVGPGQGDPLFPWLAEEATDGQMRWFLKQEVSGEAGFDDLIALTQVRMPQAAKLELARNFWDEMGRGNARGMHGPMLERLAGTLEVDRVPGPIVWESLALGNLMIALAANRRYAFQSLGALGVIELTAPGRAELVDRGLKRLEVAGVARKYFALHATLDVQHSAAWNREILTSLVAEDPRRAVAMAEGALMRLRAGARCFERYRSELWTARTGNRPTA